MPSTMGMSISANGTGLKNLPLSQAASDLGLGDQLKQQTEDETEELKKRAMQGSMKGGPLSSASVSALGLGGSYA